MKVFLDTNILIDLLRGKPNVENLFSPEITSKVSYAINPIVLQELLLISNSFSSSNALDELTKNLEILPVDVIKSEVVLDRIRSFRNRLVHTNNLLILGSAQSCDYLITNDQDLQQLSTESSVKVIPPEEFFNLMEEDK